MRVLPHVKMRAEADDAVVVAAIENTRAADQAARIKAERARNQIAAPF